MTCYDLSGPRDTKPDASSQVSAHAAILHDLTDRGWNDMHQHHARWFKSFLKALAEDITRRLQCQVEDIKSAADGDCFYACIASQLNRQQRTAPEITTKRPVRNCRKATDQHSVESLRQRTAQ